MFCVVIQHVQTSDSSLLYTRGAMVLFLGRQKGGNSESPLDCADTISAVAQSIGTLSTKATKSIFFQTRQRSRGAWMHFPDGFSTRGK